MPKFVVRRSGDQKLFMKILNNEIFWTPSIPLANQYDSAYQAKKHVRSIVLPPDVIIEQMDNQHAS